MWRITLFSKTDILEKIGISELIKVCSIIKKHISLKRDGLDDIKTEKKLDFSL